MIKPDGGNPFSGPDWYKPNVTLGSDAVYKDVADKKFDFIVKSLKDEINESILVDSTPLFDLLNFFINKYSNLLFRIKHFTDHYKFSIEGSINDNTELFMFLNDTLPKLGYVFSTLEDTNRKYWTFSTNDPLEFNDIINETSQFFINNYSIKTPSTIDETDYFTVKAHIMKDQLDENAFNEWLAIEREKWNKIWEAKNTHRK